MSYVSGSIRRLAGRRGREARRSGRRTPWRTTPWTATTTTRRATPTPGRLSSASPPSSWSRSLDRRLSRRRPGPSCCPRRRPPPPPAARLSLVARSLQQDSVSIPRTCGGKPNRALKRFVFFRHKCKAGRGRSGRPRIAPRTHGLARVTPNTATKVFDYSVQCNAPFQLPQRYYSLHFIYKSLLLFYVQKFYYIVRYKLYLSIN